MYITSPDNNHSLKLESNHCNSDLEDDFSDYLKNDGADLDVEKKKRRGKIEKRRRDRINSSLAELKDLVPSAVAKQNTTKLEKAEILKLTVDYLKDVKANDPSRLRYNNYHGLLESRLSGYRECMNEVSRFMLHREGMSSQNPLYMGLMEHLQYCSQIPYNAADTLAMPINSSGYDYTNKLSTLNWSLNGTVNSNNNSNTYSNIQPRLSSSTTPITHLPPQHQLQYQQVPPQQQDLSFPLQHQSYDSSLISPSNMSAAAASMLKFNTSTTSTTGNISNLSQLSTANVSNLFPHGFCHNNAVNYFSSSSPVA